MSNTQGINPDFIALDNSRKRYRDVEAYARTLHPRAQYAITGTAYGVVLLERRTG